MPHTAPATMVVYGSGSGTGLFWPRHLLWLLHWIVLTLIRPLDVTILTFVIVDSLGEDGQ